MSYIEREALLEHKRKMKGFDLSIEYWSEAVLCEDIRNAPTADVVEVRHGEWFIWEYEYFTCSECGHDYYNGCEYTAQAKERLENGEHPNFCPNCGAKMDGERREE